MSDILTPDEIARCESYAKQAATPNDAKVIHQLAESHRALAAERDKARAVAPHTEETGEVCTVDCQGCNDPIAALIADRNDARDTAFQRGREIERLEAQVRELTGQRQEWLIWADSLAGNQHYLPSKMRQEIAERLRTLTEERDASVENERRLALKIVFLEQDQSKAIESFRERAVRAIRARYDSLWIEVGNLPMGSKKSETRCKAELAGELASLVGSLPLNEEKL